MKHLERVESEKSSHYTFFNWKGLNERLVHNDSWKKEHPNMIALALGTLQASFSFHARKIPFTFSISSAFSFPLFHRSTKDKSFVWVGDFSQNFCIPRKLKSSNIYKRVFVSVNMCQ